MAQNYVNSISRTQKLNQTFLDSSNLYSFQKKTLSSCYQVESVFKTK